MQKPSLEACLVCLKNTKKLEWLEQCAQEEMGVK